MRFWNSPGYDTLPSVKKRDRDYMAKWDDREDINSGQAAVVTFKPPKIIFRTVQRDRKAPWIQRKSARRKNARTAVSV